MADWVCKSLGGSLIPRLHLATDTTVQTLAPNEPLLLRLGL